MMWGLVFFLLENVEEQMTDTEVAPAILQLALTLVTAHSLSPSVHLALLQVRLCAVYCEKCSLTEKEWRLVEISLSSVVLTSWYLDNANFKVSTFKSVLGSIVNRV